MVVRTAPGVKQGRDQPLRVCGGGAILCRMKRFLAIFFLATPALATGWQSYVNERFGTSVDVPPGFVNDVEPAENGDGLTFHDRSKAAELLVWGRNLAGRSFKEDAAESAKSERGRGFNVTYEKVHNLSLKGGAKGWYVLSGEASGRLFYEKAVASCRGEQAVSFRLEYPESQKAAFDPIVERLSASLRAVPARDCPG